MGSHHVVAVMDYESLRDAIALVEGHLRSGDWRYTASVPLSTGRLCWGKRGGRWHLLWKANEEDNEKMPLASAPRDVRIQAASSLDRLLAAISVSREETAEDMESATRLYIDFAERLDKAKDTPA